MKKDREDMRKQYRQPFPTGVQRIALIGVMAALSYIGFQFLRIDLPVPGGKMAFHMGNSFLVASSLLLGPLSGALAGSIGLTLADLTSGYQMYAPMTFLMKMGIGLITGLVAHKIGKLYAVTERKSAIRWSLLGSGAGMLFNVIAYPIVSYFYQRYLLGIPQDPAEVWAKFAVGTSAVNAVIAVIVATLIYLAAMPLKRTWQTR